MTRTLASAFAGAAAAGAIGAAIGAWAAEESPVRKSLDAISQRRIFFGHQSVGMNLLEGLGQLAADEGTALRIRDVSDAPAAPPATFAHAFIPENGNPALKMERFARALAAIPAPGPDIALMKLCYVDFSAGTDAKALFARYEATIAELKARHPATTFVHVTAPLTTVQAGPKALAKKLLGKEPWGLAENARREEYNALVRAAYGGREPILDLAAIESTAPDGTARFTEWKGRKVPTLAAEYTDDGGHLNAVGRLRAARALTEVLARIPLRTAAAQGAPR